MLSPSPLSWDNPVDSERVEYRDAVLAYVWSPVGTAFGRNSRVRMGKSPPGSRFFSSSEIFLADETAETLACSLNRSVKSLCWRCHIRDLRNSLLLSGRALSRSQTFVLLGELWRAAHAHERERETFPESLPLPFQPSSSGTFRRNVCGVDAPPRKHGRVNALASATPQSRREWFRGNKCGLRRDRGCVQNRNSGPRDRSRTRFTLRENLRKMKEFRRQAQRTSSREGNRKHMIDFRRPMSQFEDPLVLPTSSPSS